MTSAQRRTKSQTILDSIETLDNDANSIESQRESSINDFNDSSKEDYVLRNNLINIIQLYNNDFTELSIIGGYQYKRDESSKDIISFLKIENVDYGQYIYGKQRAVARDCKYLFDTYFKKYGEKGDRSKKFKSGKYYDEKSDKVMSGEDGPEFTPNIIPINCLETGVPGSQDIFEKIDNVVSVVNDYKKGINYPGVSGVELKQKGVRHTYNTTFSGTGTTINFSNNTVMAYTNDLSKSLLVEVSGNVTYNQGTCNITLSVTPLEEPPYRMVTETYIEKFKKKTRQVKKYYQFYPYKANKNASEDIKCKLANGNKKVITTVLEQIRNYAEDGVKPRYSKFCDIYNSNFTKSNISSFFSNIEPLKNLLRTRLRECLIDWTSDTNSSELNKCYSSRMNKDDGTLKRWYDGAVSIDKMKDKYDKKVNDYKKVFNDILVQRPAVEFSGGNTITIDEKCSQYYNIALGKYPIFNKGDTVYIVDETNNETCCIVTKKETVKIEDSVSVKYKTVTRADGTTENVAEVDKNGEPITIYTYKNATKLTFNGTVPRIYDEDTVRIIKEL